MPHRNVDKLVEFFNLLDVADVRVIRPSPFIFFCGGRLSKANGAPYTSLRDYVLTKPLKLPVRAVLAEDAVHLFKDAKYSNLIDFEANIAQISDLVVLVCESAGSLAELGAFSQVPEIARRLYAIVQQIHYDQDSFVRLGPLRALEEKDPNSVGALPWKVSVDGNLDDLSDLQKYDGVIEAAVESMLRHETEKLDLNKEGHQVLFVYWICFMLRAATLEEIYAFFKSTGHKIDHNRIQNFLYCMRVAGWIEFMNVGRGYYVPHFDRDPFEYAYKVKEDGNLTKAEKFKTDIAGINREDKLRPQAVIDRIGTGDPPPPLGKLLVAPK